MAELADAPDLGSGVPDVQVQVLSPALTYGVELRRFYSLLSSFFMFISVGKAHHLNIDFYGKKRYN